MGRLKETEVAGKKFPLNFSTKAAKEVEEKFGGIENLECLFAKDTVAGVMEKVVCLLHLLMEQGVAYKKIAEGEEIETYSLEELETLICFGDITKLQDDLLQAIYSGMEPEVEVETEGKNEETTQVN